MRCKNAFQQASFEGWCEQTKEWSASDPSAFLSVAEGRVADSDRWALAKEAMSISMVSDDGTDTASPTSPPSSKSASEAVTEDFVFL